MILKAGNCVRQNCSFWKKFFFTKTGQFCLTQLLAFKIIIYCLKNIIRIEGTMIILDGKETARKTRERLKLEVDHLKEKGIKPKLAVIMVGNNSASQIYVRNKSKACDEIGIEFEEYKISDKKIYG